MSKRSTRDDAMAWCSRLARDRVQSTWSIKFTTAEIESSPATQLAWRAYCAARHRLGVDAPRPRLWSEAEQILRDGWGDLAQVAVEAGWPEPSLAARSTVPTVPPQPKPSPPPPPKKPNKEQPRVAKKQSRRSISVSRKLYEQAKAFAAEKGVSLSQLTEAALQQAMKNP